MSLIRHCHTFEISARIKYQFVSTQIDVFNRVAQCTLVRRLTFEFVLMFDDEANTESMTEFNVMKQIGEAPKTKRMWDTASDIPLLPCTTWFEATM